MAGCVGTIWAGLARLGQARPDGWADDVSWFWPSPPLGSNNRRSRGRQRKNIEHFTRCAKFVNNYGLILLENALKQRTTKVVIVWNSRGKSGQLF